MTPRFDEGNQSFEFDDTWLVERWDTSTKYRDGLQNLNGSRAVDFIAAKRIGRRKELYFIEVTDYRGYPMGKKNDAWVDDLAKEVAVKVRDSIAGLVGAFATTGSSPWTDFLRTFRTTDPQIKVLLLVSEDFRRPPCGRREGLLDVLTKEMKRQLRWLSKRVRAVDGETPDESLGIVASNADDSRRRT